LLGAVLAAVSGLFSAKITVNRKAYKKLLVFVLYLPMLSLLHQMGGMIVNDDLF
jgi:hypothetical protein